MNPTYKIKTVLHKIRLRTLKPTIAKSVIEQCTENRYLPPSSTSKPGMWQPFFQGSVEPMEAVTRKGVRKITIMGPSQLFKTDYLLNVIFYFTTHEPCPIILAQPVEKLSESFSKDKIDPLINSNPLLRDLIKNKRERDSDNNIMLKKFNNGASLNIVSAASVSDLASRSCRVVLMDELDRFKNLGSEGDPETLLNERTNSYSYNSLNIAASTPTNDKTSRIANRFEKSSKHFFHAVCPHCFQPEKLLWTNVKWPTDQQPEEAYYLCSQCTVPWSEQDRSVAVRNGYYIPENPEVTDHLGYHCNAIASPWQSLESLVNKFIEAKKDPEKLKAFVNTSLAEVWKPKIDVPEWNRLYERRENYTLGQIPNSVVFLTAGVDVQNNRLECSVYGWNRNKESFLVDHLVLDGMSHTKEPWDELTKVIQRNYKFQDSDLTLPITMTCIDSGFNTSVVYEYVSQFNPNKVRAIKGSDSLITSYKISSPLQTSFNGVKNPYSHHLYSVGSSMLKESIYSKLRLNAPVDSEDFPKGYPHFPELDSEFFKQLTAEAYVQKKSKWEWVKIQSRNEALDLFVYATAAAHMKGLDRYQPSDWEILEQRIQEPNLEDSTSKPKIIKPAARPTSQNSSLWKYPGLKR